MPLRTNIQISNRWGVTFASFRSSTAGPLNLNIHIYSQVHSNEWQILNTLYFSLYNASRYSYWLPLTNETEVAK